MLTLFKDKKCRAFVVCFIVCLVAFSTTVRARTLATAAISASAPLPWLHVDGKYIKDAQGNVVILHGVNFEGYEVTPYLEYGWSNHTEEDYRKIGNWGFSVVRLPISWQHFEPTEGSYDENYFVNFVDRDVGWAQKYGIYIILSFAQWKWSPYWNYTSGGYGFPSWLFYGYPDSEDGKSQSINDFWLGMAPGGAVATPENPSMQDRMIQAWKYIADRYKNNSTVIAYDLFNEPGSGSLGTDSASNYLYAFIERLMGEIKTVDSNHIFIYEPIVGRWDYSPRLLSTPNTIFSIHLYPGYNDATRLGYSGDVGVLEDQILGYFDLPQSNPSKNWDIPILMGEFGPSQSMLYGNRILWVNDMADVYNKYNIHWTYFAYAVSSREIRSMINPDRTEITEIVDALDKPYPRLSSIPPSQYSFNRDTKLFEVTFKGVGNVETQIYVPYRYYPNGFSVNSNSSQWTRNWDEVNRILTVNASLQSAVQITITLGGPTQGKAMIIGKVTNAQTGVGIAGATVSANGYQTTTGVGGAYSLEVALGTYSLSVNANGYEGKTQTLNASEEKTYTVDFALTQLPPDQSQSLPRNAILIGGAVIVTAVVVTVALLARRKKGNAVRR